MQHATNFEKDCKPVVCFILNAPAFNRHAAMTAVACASVRLSNRELPVKLFVDPETYRWIAPRFQVFVDRLEFVEVVESNHESMEQRNRCIKTRLRQLVRGPIAYIDGDVIMRRGWGKAFSEVAMVNADLGLATDWNESNPQISRQNGLEQNHWPELREFKWRAHALGYFNGGVIVLMDTPKAFEFSVLWNENWKKSCKTGVYKDQPALNESLVESGAAVYCLPTRYNAVVANYRTMPRRPKLLHFYNTFMSLDTRSKTILDVLVDSTLQLGKVDERLVDRYMNTLNLWCDDQIIRRNIWSRNYTRVVCLIMKRLRETIRSRSNLHEKMGG